MHSQSIQLITGQRVESFWFDDGSSLTADQIEAMLPQASNTQAAPSNLMLSGNMAEGGEWVVVFADDTTTSPDSYWVKGQSAGQRWVQRRGPFPATERLDGLLIVTEEGVHSWKRDPVTKAHHYRKLDSSWMQRVVLNTSGGSAGLDEVWSYTRDPAGNITAITLPNRTGTYQYDALDRLISEALGTDPAIAYQYDRNGNRTSETVDQAQTIYNYTANTNVLKNVGTEAITHDAAGNRTSDRSGARTFEYNGAGRLYRVFEGGALVATYTYNVLGQRTRKVTSAGTVLYHYDLDGKLLTETDADGNVLREYIYADGIPIAQVDRIAGSDDITYLHTDHLGTPRAGTDANGVLVWRWLGQAFGASPADEDPDGDGQATVVKLRFPGQYADAETGLYYNYFRYYEPETGRYVTSDPIGLTGGFNTFVYVNSRPWNYRDAYGLRYSPAEHGLDWNGNPLNQEPINLSVGAGGAGMFMFNAGSADSGISLDSTGTVCTYQTICAGLGINSPIAGELNIVGSLGKGRLCSGSKEIKGAYWYFGQGIVGQGQVTSDGSLLRGFLGIGGAPTGPMSGAGGLKCRVVTQCWFEPPECSCEQ